MIEYYPFLVAQDSRVDRVVCWGVEGRRIEGESRSPPQKSRAIMDDLLGADFGAVAGGADQQQQVVCRDYVVKRGAEGT